MALQTPSIGDTKTPRRRSFMAQPFKHPSSGLFYLRRKVPQELQGVLGREFKRSLKTREPGEAKRRFAEEWAKSEEAFTLARAQSKGAETLSQSDMDVLAGRWAEAELAKMEASGDYSHWLVKGTPEARGQGDSYEEWVPMTSVRQELEEDPEAEDLLADTTEAIRSALRQHNIPVPKKGTSPYEALARIFREHLLRLSDHAYRRHRGDWQAQFTTRAVEPLRVDLKSSSKKSKSLLEVFEEYAQDRRINDGDDRATRKTLGAYRAGMEEFVELCGDLQVTDVKRETIRLYRAELAKIPARGDGVRKLTALQKIAKAEAEGLPRIGEATIRNKLLALSAVLSHALRMGLISENAVIASGIGRATAKAATKRAGAKRGRNHYDADELKTIFASEIFATKGATVPSPGFGQAWYWLPQLMYYTGARREELAQLYVSDLKSHKEAGPYLSILDAGDDEDDQRTVKTEQARRSIPIHPDLVTRGFVDYVESLPKGGQIFPELKPNTKGYYGASFGKHWGNYLRKVLGLNSPAKPAHGFRHTFKTLCRTVGIPEDVHDALTGHVGAGAVARKYGDMPLSRMSVEIKKYPVVPIQYL